MGGRTIGGDGLRVNRTMARAQKMPQSPAQMTESGPGSESFTVFVACKVLAGEH